MSDEEAFWSQVEKTSGCWWWRGWRGSRYGSARVGGRQVRAHRAAWQFARGPIPPGLFVCHHCDHPPCVNPAHLFVGTAMDNVRDMETKGRGRPKKRRTTMDAAQAWVGSAGEVS